MPAYARAATITAPGQIEVREYAIPPLRPGGLLMQIEMSGICGTDKHTFRGETTQYGGTVNEQTSPFPLIPGHENVGVVAEITPGAVDFYGEPLRVGDRITMCPDVVCGKCYNCRHIFAYSWCEHWRGYGNSFRATEEPLMGGWAEYMVIIPEAFVYKVPDGLAPELAVYTEIMACTYALDKAKEFSSLASEGFLTDDTVLIQGVGPLGLCHLIKARMMGAGVIIALDTSNYRLNMAKAFGADYTLNVSQTTAEERIQLVRGWSRGRGVDVAIECVGYPEAVPEALHMIRRGGMYILEGVFVDMGDIPLNPHLIVSKGLRLIGLSNHPFTGYRPSMELLLRYQDQMPLHTFVTHRYPLEQAQQAMQTALGLECMKVVFTPHSDE
jgi:threonine dehydrogenase-like Zn-dependent dehydrogenase